ncbi:HNH endonuclease [Shewanella olleyana]|uniref:HNH endonuclease n=1 Tax=Shewanella olleyana TaxID=135626 RepID=UPI00200C1CA9|nr:HNH endonuclease [Shewanella olleyana]MCL1067450.1 HNH endonuclease [Shewanella olleyana]
MAYSGLKKPFPEYRWKWGPLTLTESLNIPEVYLGCLKVLYANQGVSVSSQSVEDGLQVVQNELSKLINGDRPLRLARGTERNLFRNSSQYWKFSGLLISTSPRITLSELGIGYASGQLTKGEFASYTVKKLQLPNTYTENDEQINCWKSQGLLINPLELLLSLIVQLYEYSSVHGYLTTEELIHVVIPLSGNKYTQTQISQGILDYRADHSTFNGAWVANDGDNDSRIAREFLLFLNYYEFLGKRDSTVPNCHVSRETQEFFLREEQIESIKSLITLDCSALHTVVKSPQDSINTAIEIDQKIQALDVIRERKLVEVLSRPSQPRFRKDVLQSGDGVCILSGVNIKEALQACHIIPVQNNGSDDKSNGILLRADLHTLYDKGHILIDEEGLITISDYLKKDEFYSQSLPSQVNLPKYINIEAIRIRNTYRMWI